MDMDDDAQVTEWTEEEKKLVAPCSGLVKVMHFFLHWRIMVIFSARDAGHC